METYLPILFGFLSILIAMWVPLIAGPGGVSAKRVLAWCSIVLATLIVPSILLTWGVMQISARILAPTANNLSDFVSQIGWAVGAFSASYPLIWGVRFYPSLEKYVSELVSNSRNDQKKARKTSERKKGGKP